MTRVLNANVAFIQATLVELGFQPGPIDGDPGIRTMAALDAALASPAATARLGLPWGARVTPVFRERLYEVCERAKITPAYLMACIAWESGESFSPSIKNAAGSGATGLIQFMPATARGLGTSVEALAALSAVQQLAYVERYFSPYKGRLDTLSDHYMAILWPAAIGKPESSPLWSKENRPTTYRQNSGLDIDKDGVITKAEAARKVTEKLFKGFGVGYVHYEP